MPQYKSLATEPMWVDVAGTLTRVDPGGILTIPDHHTGYVQTGACGEPALFAAVTASKTKEK